MLVPLTLKHLTNQSYHRYCKHMKSCLILGGLLSVWVGMWGQAPTNVLRGEILDRRSGEPLKAVRLTLAGEGVSRETSSDSNGVYRFSNVPVGSYQLGCQVEAYQPYIKDQLFISAHKERIVNIRLTPSLYAMDEVILVPGRSRGTTLNEMASVSTWTFEIEETRKFAGGLDDPTRLAANFPGIIATPLISENFIAIRGNSSRGLLYRVEGIDIPNPNHFARIGSSGGTFTIFSNQVLANSDFFVGAFPAEYGNATSGVFDIQFRNGNNERREYALQAGVLGVDFAAEGPFKQGGKASYLVNYRFASLNLVNLLINYLTLPTYSDLSFKLHLPTKSAGVFSVFGIGGISNRLREAETENFGEDLERFENRLRSNMGAVGITHRLLLPTGGIWETKLLGSYSFQLDNKRYLEDTTDLESFRQREVNEYERLPLTINTSVKHLHGNQLTSKLGAQYTYALHDYLSQGYDYVLEQEITRAREAGPTQQFQTYAQLQWRPNSRLTLHTGLHYLYYQLTQAQSLEPRVGLVYQLSQRQKLSFGYGLHSRVEHWGTYQTRIVENNSVSLPNLSLRLMKAHHGVIGYQALLSDKLRARGEVYYQALYDVPVEATGTYSTLNLNELNQLRVLVNEGTGRNYGLDLGIERFSRRGFYYMLNGSVFSSTYTDQAGNRYSTAFDNGYKVNFLLGKDLSIGKQKGRNNLLSLNGTFSFVGGQRFTALDLGASAEARTTVLDESRPFINQEDPLFIVDLTANIFQNKPKYNATWSLQIKNLFQSSIPEYREWDATLEREIALRGAAVLPVLSYKVEF